MVTQNKTLIRITVFIGALLIITLSSKNLFNYFSFKFKGSHTNGKVINHKRINGHGQLHPFIQFTTAENKLIETNSKSALPSLFKVRGKYYAINDVVEIAYKTNNPKEATILSHG
jgi:hypothetical protein